MKYRHQTDTDLICLMKEGDKKAFDAFFSRHYAVLCAYAKQYVGFEDGEDIVQDVMAGLWMNRNKVIITESPRSYLFKSVKNRCLNLLSRNEMKEKINKTVHESMEPICDSSDFYVIEELRKQIDNSLERLPENYRKAFVLNRFKNMTYKEIATEMSISPKTIDYRIQQALRILRRDLKEYLPLFLGIF